MLGPYIAPRIISAPFLLNFFIKIFSSKSENSFTVVNSRLFLTNMATPLLFEDELKKKSKSASLVFSNAADILFDAL